jgi:cytochrome b561
VARIFWRLTHRPAPLPPEVPRWQARLAKLTEAALYIVIALMPLTGYLGASYSKSGVAFFGAPTPSWASPNHDTAEFFFGIHSFLIWVLVALVAAHVLGALKHLLIDRDGVFRRMSFIRRS